MDSTQKNGGWGRVGRWGEIKRSHCREGQFRIKLMEKATLILRTTAFCSPYGAFERHGKDILHRSKQQFYFNLQK